MLLRTEEMSFEDIKNAIELTILLVRENTESKEEFLKVIVGTMASYHGLLALREATIATMVETI
ncbi:hypothetical protein GNF82_13575 [Clostridium perfringens]